MSALTTKIEEKISPIVNEMGFEIVRVALFGSDMKKTLQIMIEKSNGDPINIKDCEDVSRAVSVCLDVMDPISGHYNLEVSSTGIDRPLVKPSDFVKFQGKSIVVKTYVMKNDRKIFKGSLEFASENGINLILDMPLTDGNTKIDFTYDEISSAYIDGSKQF